VAEFLDSVPRYVPIFWVPLGIFFGFLAGLIACPSQISTVSTTIKMWVSNRG
jgi:hypothetical protein